MSPEIFFVRVNEPIEDDIFEYLISFIHAEKRERIMRQRNKCHKDTMLIGEILAMIALKKIFGINMSKEKILCGEHGKPYLSDYPHVHYNISHSENLVVCAVCSKPVGVDIQRIAEYKPALARRVCSDEEMELIEGSVDKASEFTRVWTMKEAVLKKRGTGITDSNIKHCLEGEFVWSERIENYWVSISLYFSIK